MISIRHAKPEDAKALVEIYKPYVEHTAITFEYEVPTVEEFTQRIETTLQKYPYLVAEYYGEIVGYAYAAPFKTRAAYQWSVEVSVYVKRGKQGLGAGRLLYEALEHKLVNQGITNMYACIAYPETEDQYLTKNSARFHEHMGFSLIGEFHKCAYKFETWYNMIWMEKWIGTHK